MNGSMAAFDVPLEGATCSLAPRLSKWQSWRTICAAWRGSPSFRSARAWIAHRSHWLLPRPRCLARAASTALPRPLFESIADRLETLRESIACFSIAYPAPDYASLAPAMAPREDLMKRHIRRIRAAMRLRDRLVLIGHALHLVKSDGLIEAAGGVGPGGGITTSLGHDLHQLGADALVIWMIYGEGEDSQLFVSLPRTHTYAANTLNAHLLSESVHRGGRGLVIPTKAPFLGKVWDIGHMYGATFRARPSEQADAIVFFPRVTPLRE